MDSFPVFYALVVLYNKNGEDSLTLSSLENAGYPKLQILVADNSTVPNNNKAYCKSRQYGYINMHGNKGLAAAYNKAIDGIPKESAFICLFDDDTTVPAGYFVQLEKAIKNNPDAEIFIPTIYDDAGLLSPCLFDGLRGKRKEKWDGDFSGCSAINSGMCIRTSVFKDYHYDEGLFLDYVDHQFIMDMNKKQKKIIVFDSALQQSFADSSGKVLKKSALARYSIFKKDFVYYCRKHNKNTVKSKLYLWSRKAKLCWRYKTIAFLNV